MISKVSFPLGVSHSDITLLFCYDNCSSMEAIFYYVVEVKNEQGSKYLRTVWLVHYGEETLEIVEANAEYDF